MLQCVSAAGASTTARFVALNCGWCGVLQCVAVCCSVLQCVGGNSASTAARCVAENAVCCCVVHFGAVL